MTAPTRDERLARLEAAVERLVREVCDVKANGRDLRAEMRDTRAVMRRNFLITIGVLVSTWLVTISLLLVALFRM